MSLSRIAAKAAVATRYHADLGWRSRANEIKGKVSVQGIKSAENIAVYVDVIPDKKFDAPKEHVVIDQRKMAFIPHVVAVQQGTTVDFLNSDPVGHNVYWPSISGNKKLAHNLGTWPKGDKKPFQFNDLGTASLLCNVHPGNVRLCRRCSHALFCGDRQRRQFRNQEHPRRKVHVEDVERRWQTDHASRGRQRREHDR